MKVFLIAEHDSQGLKGSTLAILSAALQITSDVTLFLAGHHLEKAIVQASQTKGVTKVFSYDDPLFDHPTAEALVKVIFPLVKGYTHIFAPATTFGKNMLPRLAAELDCQQISDVIEVVDSKTFKRPIYAGNAIATVESLEPVVIATIRPSAFERHSENQTPCSVEALQVSPFSVQSHFVKDEITPLSRPDLGAARIVVSGGRGLKSGDHFKLLEPLADRLGAAIGASRAAVDAGFISNDYQVGQTGKIVAPDLYIAVGISGAIQHLAGMKESKIIVAINKDPDAPIFQVADYGLVQDLFTALPELCEALDRFKSTHPH